MSWGRGMLRLWLVLSVLWIGFIAVVTPPPYEVLRLWQAGIILLALIPPVFLLVAGASLVWAFSGFRHR